MESFIYSLKNLQSHSNKTFMESIAAAQPTIQINQLHSREVSQEIIHRFAKFVDSLTDLFELDGADDFNNEIIIRLTNGQVYLGVHGFIRKSQSNPDPNHLEYATFIIVSYSDFINTDLLLEKQILELSPEIKDSGIKLSETSLPLDNPDALILEIHIPLKLIYQISTNFNIG